MQADAYVASGSDSDYNKYWVDWFLSVKGNEYFCEIDDEYIVDRFNLTDLNNEVQHYEQALDLITDNLEDENIDNNLRAEIEKSARHLYGLIHARYIVTHRGLQKMLEKYKRGEFGRCPRVYCANHPVLPIGLHDMASIKSVKLYCPKCEDVYSPKSARHAAIDGAYFGTTFPHILFQVYPNALPPRGQNDFEVYVPRIFGFKLHPSSGQLGRNALRAYVDSLSSVKSGPTNRPGLPQSSSSALPPAASIPPTSSSSASSSSASVLAGTAASAYPSDPATYRAASAGNFASASHVSIGTASTNGAVNQDRDARDDPNTNSSQAQLTSGRN